MKTYRIIGGALDGWEIEAQFTEGGIVEVGAEGVRSEHYIVDGERLIPVPLLQQTEEN